MKFIYLLCCWLLATTAMAQEIATEVFYFTPLLGHVHQSPARTSPSLTTIQCGHPLKVLSDSKVVVGADWAYVQVADWKGFVWKKHLSAKRLPCFQGNYPKFFDALNLDLAELYYWGRLHDHWEEGMAKP